jgi:hypothetical protein
MAFVEEVISSQELAGLAVSLAQFLTLILVFLMKLGPAAS